MTAPREVQDGQPGQARIRGWLPALFVSLFISLAIVSAFFSLGNAPGHDFQYHAASWLDAAGQWKEGIVFPLSRGVQPRTRVDCDVVSRWGPKPEKRRHDQRRRNQRDAESKQPAAVTRPPW